MIWRPKMVLSPFPTPLFLLMSHLFLFTIIGSSSDLTDLVYKGCADQNLQDRTGVSSQFIRTLLDTLVSQSSNKKFYNTTSGEGQSAIDGLFQCRGDLSNADCNKCVGKIPLMFSRLCGKTIAARVQLTGCYMRYEVAGFKQVPETQLLYKVCGSTQASGVGFEGRLDAALGEIEKGVGSGNGFYTGGYESVYVLGQCEGDLGSGDCVNCVKSAVEQSKSQCVTSISGQIYLQQCYISYAYYPNGVPRQSFTGEGSGRNTQKTVAIVLGGLVGLGLGIAFLLVLKSLFKKKGRSKFYGG